MQPAQSAFGREGPSPSPAPTVRGRGKATARGRGKAAGRGRGQSTIGPEEEPHLPVEEPEEDAKSSMYFPPWVGDADEYFSPAPSLPPMSLDWGSPPPGSPYAKGDVYDEYGNKLVVQQDVGSSKKYLFEASWKLIFQAQRSM